MLIPQSDIINILYKHHIFVKGALHIGAHECEEIGFYNNIGISNNNIIWIEGNKTKVLEAQQRNIPNVYYGLITDTDDADISFNITNNGQSSSVLEFGSHIHNHPEVCFIEKQSHKTVTIDTFFERNGLETNLYDFWNFDIQGAELMALKGASNSIQYAKAIYLEVNTEEVYKGNGLMNEIDDFLEKYNFKRVLTNITSWGWGDALYIKS